ncbi:MAG TPA: beta-ketoacyl-ACP synthase II [Syntrophorhabdus sp.]|nr:beta-ketoacyl-ACP synthase II [Pseudomonadota bacterium]NMC95112.1 beta-ketoacyl-ACP synthase II [Syntrophorhabdus sp.]OQB75782.1 MAG: 3-oxoacyl-(acyl-carrier-protein) synthase 2 [Deltaproteobacteria bacterium ADurb.Bin135]HNS77958.1 beta-ketoacyl-ACP synthase II [Syntrophorhabdus sp.]HQG26265.1 beta-ketoacyl-ACP synthase II [Syntrophorhabdus sp.]
MKRRVVVTGIGLVTPCGIGTDNVWNNILSGKSGIGPITRFNTDRFDTKFAGEVKDFNPEDYVQPKEVKKMDLFIHYALAAAHIAVKDAGLDMGKEDPERVGVVVGTGLGGLPTIEKYHSVLLERGPGRITPFFIPMLIANEAPGHIAIQHGMKGPNLCIVTACATGAHSIGDACRIIQYGDADVMVAGGSEANLTPLTVGGFNAMKALSTRNNDPMKASRPFDRDRDGFVVAEGSGIIILEELEHAKKRGARIYAEMAGYGYNGDAYHITAPCPDGDGFIRCMRMALRDAHISPDHVDYINAHGTSTKLNDYIETLAIKEVFKEKAYRIPVSSTKSMTGHLLGAAGAVEAVFSILSIRDQVCPPTINYENPDPECDLDYVPNTARKCTINTVVSNGFGFGGTNSTLVFRRFIE